MMVKKRKKTVKNEKEIKNSKEKSLFLYLEKEGKIKSCGRDKVLFY